MKCWLWGEMGKPELQYQGKKFKKGWQQSREPTNSIEYEFKPVSPWESIYSYQ